MTAPTWALGHPEERLRQLAEIFAEHDRGLILGAFGKVREVEIAQWLNRDALRWSPGAAVALHQVRRPSPLRDFRGEVVATMLPGEWHAHRWAGSADSVATLALAGVHWLSGWVEHPATAALAERLRMVRVATKVRAASELVAVYASPEVAARCAPLPPEEAVGIAPLALAPLPDSVLAAAAREAERVPQLVGWADHYSSYNKRKSWSAVSLRGYGGPEAIEKPAEMSRAWRAAHPERLELEAHETAIARELPACCVLTAFVPGEKQRVRLMRLRPGGGELTRHADITDDEAGLADGKVARVHIPLTTNASVVFGSWSLDGVEQRVHMERGRAWYLDTRKPHRALNSGVTDRVHLVVDVFSSAKPPERTAMTDDLLARAAEFFNWAIEGTEVGLRAHLSCGLLIRDLAAEARNARDRAERAEARVREQDDLRAHYEDLKRLLDATLASDERVRASEERLKAHGLDDASNLARARGLLERVTAVSEEQWLWWAEHKATKDDFHRWACATEDARAFLAGGPPPRVPAHISPELRESRRLPHIDGRPRDPAPAACTCGGWPLGPPYPARGVEHAPDCPAAGSRAFLAGTGDAPPAPTCDCNCHKETWDCAGRCDRDPATRCVGRVKNRPAPPPACTCRCGACCDHEGLSEHCRRAPDCPAKP